MTHLRRELTAVSTPVCFIGPQAIVKARDQKEYLAMWKALDLELLILNFCSDLELLAVHNTSML